MSGMGHGDLPLKGQMPYKPRKFRHADHEEIAKVTRFAMEMQQLATEGAILDDANIDVIPMMYDQFAVSFRGYLFGEEMQTSTVRYPDGWWQALRQRWLPAFWLRRRPVVEIVVVTEVRALYPELHRKLQFPDENHVIHVVDQEFVDDGADVKELD